MEVIQEHIRKTFENKDVQVFEFKMSFPDGERHFEASMVSASQQGGTDDELAEYWHHLRSELDRQRSLIERLLTVGRLETGSLKLNPVPLNILPILEEAVSSVYPMAALKGIQIQKDVNGDVPDVIGDKGGLEQVFTNLLNNAVKFSNNDGEVKIIVQNNNNGVSVWVKDQGVGIPENDLPNLFEGFFRAQNAMDRGIPGSGVGLYIVKSIITELGGTVNAESVLDVGTTFEVWLPAFSG